MHFWRKPVQNWRGRQGDGKQIESEPEFMVESNEHVIIIKAGKIVTGQI
jgi:hypothetical protein